MRGVFCAVLLGVGVSLMSPITPTTEHLGAYIIGAMLLGSVAQILAYPPRDR